MKAYKAIPRIAGAKDEIMYKLHSIQQSLGLETWAAICEKEKSMFIMS